jgi:adenylate cyclase
MDGMLALVERSLADRRSRKEKEQLGRYVSKASMRMAIEKAILGTGEEEARADRKSASVFFSDIANFTDRCERYSAKEIVEQINLLFSVMTNVIISNQGDIDKFIGDACMAFWLDDETKNSNNSLLKSILEMQEKITFMNTTHPVLVEDPIVVRMGANTGEVILCDLGSTEARVDLTIIGDPVNVAARLESASKQYGITNLVSEYTLNGYGEKYCYRIIDKVRVKGKTVPLSCYELLSVIEKETKEQIELKEAFELGFSLYQKGKFEKAKSEFNRALSFEIRASNDVNPSKLYISRCEHLIKSPPSNWDGTWFLNEK